MQVHSFKKDVQTNTSGTSVFQRWHGVTVFYAAVALISSLFGILGNGSVLVIAYQQRTQLSPCKLHIAQLALVNFVFCVVQSINVVPLYWTNTWFVCFRVVGFDRSA